MNFMPTTRSRLAPTPPDEPGAVRGGPLLLLRLEGAVMLLGGLLAYARLGGGLGELAVLFLAPDLTLLGYVLGPRVGAALYNAGHGTLGPALLAGAGLGVGAPAWTLLAASVWVAHIGFDRTLGFGLKYARGFGDTHLGAIGRAARRAPGALGARGCAAVTARGAG